MAIIDDLLKGNNYPSGGKLMFDSSDHVRYQNGRDVSGHNYGCHRRVEIQENIEGGGGYTVTIYNLDGIHPMWGNNVQMAPKPMKIIKVSGGTIELRGFGYDTRAIAMGAPKAMAAYADYGIIVTIENREITKVQLNMYDRNVSLIYLK